MTAEILNGKKVADEIAENLKKEVATLSKEPEIQVIVIGDDAESDIYVRNKIKRAAEIGLKIIVNHLPLTVSQAKVINLIESFNNNKNVDGIMVQLPLPNHISYYQVINAIDPTKDMDGFNQLNVGGLWTETPNYIAPATPRGIMTLLSHYHLDVAGRNSVIIGRSNIVGKPLAGLLLDRDSTVTITHSKTLNLKKITQQADFLFVAIGQAEMIDDSYVKPGAVVIDVGMNHTPFGLKGDVDFQSVQHKASYLTPVPKGVGPMTVIALMQQLVTAVKVKDNNG